MWSVEGSYFLKTKDYTIDFESCFMIFGAIDVDDYLLVKGARGLSKSTNVFDSILLSLVLVDHFKYSISCERL